VAHRNRHLSHETSWKMNSFQTIAQQKKLPVGRIVLSSQFSVLSIKICNRRLVLAALTEN
jgi:hypothetical protein